MSERAALDARLLAWMREPEPVRDEARFAALALGLFRHQYLSCVPYRRFCDGRGRAPAAVTDWRQIPAVPTGAFKEVALRSFAPEREQHVFRTSGTSGESRGALHLDTLALYEASLLPTFVHFVLPDRAEPGVRSRIFVLAPSSEELPDSSLSHMFGSVLRERGDAESGWFVRDGALEVERLIGALEASLLEAARHDGCAPVVCGTAFALVHLLDALSEREIRLTMPAATRLMETGGFKGRVRQRARESLYEEIEERLGIPPARVVNQYGMTELGSQFYDSVLARPGEARRKLGPPWARVRILDPATGDECPPGSPGMIQILDLANTGSVAAVLTADVGRSLEEGFEVIGRAPGAEARGCSIAADEMLGARAG